MSEEADQRKTARENQRLALPLEPEEALRALLAVDPDAPPADEDAGDDEGRPQ